MNRGVCGIQTAGLMFGGSVTPSPGKQSVTESWNGSTWTEQNDLATAMTGNTAANSSPNLATFSAGVVHLLSQPQKYGLQQIFKLSQ